MISLTYSCNNVHNSMQSTNINYKTNEPKNAWQQCFFSYKKEIVKTSNSTKIINKSRERLYNTAKINFCKPEREIGLTIVALEHQ